MFRHERAIPNYPVGYPGVVSALEKELEREKGMFLSGNAFYGVGVNDTTLRAHSTARRVVDYLKEIK